MPSRLSAPRPTAPRPIALADLPEHVAIIMDGNGRWANTRGMERAMGHAEGARAVRETVRTCREAGVRYLTLYAFSLANWERPRAEVDALMRLLIRFSRQEAAELRERRINVKVVGDLDDLPEATRAAVEELMAHTNALPAGQEPAMTLSLALSYGGRRDVIDVLRMAAVRARAGLLLPEEIDETWLRQQMTTRGLPDVDLLIRTGGEQRLSDFLLVESAYAELYFTDVLWPDFSERELYKAFEAFAHRERRFGKTSEQVRLQRMQ